MNGSPDRDVAHLAAGVVAGLNQHINPNVTNRKDMELLNPNRLNINDFLPQNRANQHMRPQQQYRQPPQQQTAPQQFQGNVPAPNLNQQFAPIPLPNKPDGFIPITEDMKEVVKKETSGDFNTVVNQSNSPPTPSFQNTNFSSPVKVDISGPIKAKKSLTSEESYGNLEELTEEVRKLKTKVGTLSTRVYKLINLIESKKEDE